MEIDKTKIQNTIKDYMLLYSSEYENFKKSMAIKRKDNLNKFAEIKGTDAIIRKLAEIPENLYKMLKNNLSEPEFEYFKSFNGQKWLVKNYPVFQTPEKI